MSPGPGFRWAVGMLLLLLGVAVGSPVNAACLGVAAPLSGKHKAIGQRIQSVLSAYKDTLGRTLVFEDTRGTPAGGALAVQRLRANPCVDVVLGPVGWKVTQAVARGEGLDVALVGLSQEEGYEQASSYVFRGRTSERERTSYFADALIDELDVQTYAILAPADAPGRAAALTFFEHVRRKGRFVTAWVDYPVAPKRELEKPVMEVLGMRAPVLKTGRRPATVTRNVSSTPRVGFQALFVPDSGNALGIIANHLRYHDVPLAGVGDGFSLQLLSNRALYDGIARNEPLLAGTLFFSSFVPNARDERVFEAEFEQRFKRPPSAFDARVLDLATALGRLRCEGRDACRAGVAGLSYKGHTGKVTFTETGAPAVDGEFYVVSFDGSVQSATF